MRVFSKKRGNLIETVLSPLFVVLIVMTLVFVPLLYYTSGISKSDYYERQFLTRNIGLLVDAILASPADLKVDYPESTQGLNLTFKKNKVIAYAHNIDPEVIKSKVSFYPIIPSKINIIETTLSPKVEKDIKGKEEVYPFKFTIEKTIDEIRAVVTGTSAAKKTSSAYCNFLTNTKVNEWKNTQKIYVDILSVGVQKQNTEGYSNIQLLKSICTSLTAGTNANTFFSTTNDCKAGESIEQRAKRIQESNADLVIILLIDTKKTDQNTFNIYYQQSGVFEDKDNKLACILKGSFENLNLEYAYGKTQATTPELKQAANLFGNKPGVIIEVGNIEFLKNNDVTTLWKAIYDAIEKYYTS